MTPDQWQEIRAQHEQQGPWQRFMASPVKLFNNEHIKKNG